MRKKIELPVDLPKRPVERLLLLIKLGATEDLTLEAYERAMVHAAVDVAQLFADRFLGACEAIIELNRKKGT